MFAYAVVLEWFFFVWFLCVLQVEKGSGEEGKQQNIPLLKLTSTTV